MVYSVHDMLEYSKQDEIVPTCIQLITYIRAHPEVVHFNEKLRCIEVQHDEISVSLVDGKFADLMEREPENLLAILGVSATEVYYEKQPIGTRPCKWPVRLFKTGPIQPFRDLKAYQIGRLLTIRGNVVRVSAVRPFPSQLLFKCLKCLQSSMVIIKDGIYRTLSKCPTSHCNSKNFIPERGSPLTVCVNWQRVKLQEVTEFDSLDDDEGRIPRVMDVELTNDLVDAVVPGELISVSGILKAADAEGRGNPTGNHAAALYLDAISIQKMRSLDATLGGAASSVSIPEQRLQEIISVASNKTTLQTLVRSFCPHIYGNELVKMGLLLGLFGGSRRGMQVDPSALSIRSDPHILIVGDPGLGKSQLLSFSASVAPRAVYVCANTSTAVGLTATVQDGALEAGALVLADQGCCCIDEFDKITGDSWRSFLDVMEQQTVNVAKAGVVCALPARTSILAAANPVGGHYNKGKSVVENLKMDAALLSRFDLIFVLLDKPNLEMDKVLSEHVLGYLKQKDPKLQPASIIFTQTSQAPATLRSQLDPKNPNIPVISESLLRHYISYARQKITPKITDEAAKVIQEFYLEMRKGHVIDETLPITTRHLESMIRLSEARAKMELRNFVTAQDAHEVVELIKFCTADIVNQGGLSKIGIKAGRKGSKSGAMKRYVSELIKVSANTNETDFTLQQLQGLYDALRIHELQFPELLDALNEHGYLLKRSGSYRLLVT